MKAHTYSVLVLLDLKDNSKDLITYTIELSKKINIDIEFFSVRKPTDIIDTDSQLSAMRSINTDCVALYNEMKSKLLPISEQRTIKVKSTFAFGNAKNHIEKRIDTLLPDIVIIGKRKLRTLAFLGDNITEFLLQNYKGILLVASEANTTDAIEEIHAIPATKSRINSISA